ncbi:hypothetical protein ACFQNF_13230 [Iodobacter arcticus]|uniref:Uncharacterized protein n=1 Tax=Iodobacter arcticus TaxID=590593 RepID=A0ABW2R468_9NEIS
MTWYYAVVLNYLRVFDFRAAYKKGAIFMDFYLRKDELQKIFASLALIFSCSFSFAGGQFCAGKVSNLFVSSSGDVTANFAFRGDFLTVCNLNAEWKGVSITTCAAWFSVLKASVSRQSEATLHYLDAPSCNVIPIHQSAPAPYYVMLNN